MRCGKVKSRGWGASWVLLASRRGVEWFVPGLPRPYGAYLSSSGLGLGDWCKRVQACVESVGKGGSLVGFRMCGQRGISLVGVPLNSRPDRHQVMRQQISVEDYSSGATELPKIPLR
jgi:hypothetical protein